MNSATSPTPTPLHLASPSARGWRGAHAGRAEALRGKSSPCRTVSPSPSVPETSNDAVGVSRDEMGKGSGGVGHHEDHEDHGARARVRGACRDWRRVPRTGAGPPSPDHRGGTRQRAAGGIGNDGRRRDGSNGHDGLSGRMRDRDDATGRGIWTGSTRRAVANGRNGPAPTGTDDHTGGPVFGTSSEKSRRPARQRRPHRLPRRARQMCCVEIVSGSMS